MSFTELTLQPKTQEALQSMGFETMTPIQEQTIPLLLAGKDVIGQAQTGTGKTAAFGIPLIEAAARGERALVLAPTRELAKQVQQALRDMGGNAHCLIGGAPFPPQVRDLKRLPHVSIVGTPGRIVDHLGRGTLDLRDIRMFVLDEADEMLSMGFADELEAIVDALPKERQTVLFTATLAPAIEKLAKRALQDPVTVRIGAGAAPKVTQSFLAVPGRARADAIRRIMEAEGPRAALLFCRTRVRVEELAQSLSSLGVEALHGGMGQPLRDAVMRRFRDGQTRLLIATDVAARGLDVDEVDLVLHDEPAIDVDTYIHRIGRTARAGREGHSILFINPGKIKRLGPIRQAVGRLDKYEIPTDAAIARIRGERMVDGLRSTLPSDEAKAVVDAAVAAGMDPYDIAARAIEATLTPVPEEVPAEAGAIALKVGKIDRVHPGSIVAVLTNVGGLPAAEIGRIDILDKMSVAEVPSQHVERVCDSLARARLSGRPLLPRPAEDWRFKTAPR